MTTPRRLVRGAAHVHTHYSYDGTLTPEQVRAEGLRRGWSFILVTEHSDRLTPEAFAALEADCRRLSDDAFLMLPSLEYTCRDKLHILGYGGGYIAGHPAEPVDLCRAVQSRGGLAILAHPRKYTHRPGLISEALLQAVDGVEIWNAKLSYDGMLVPPLRNYELLRPGKLGLCGQDVHVMRHFRSLVLELRVEHLDAASLLAQLRSGDYRMSNGRLTMHPSQPPTGAAALFYRGVHAASRVLLDPALALRRWAHRCASRLRRAP